MARTRTRRRRSSPRLPKKPHKRPRIRKGRRQLPKKGPRKPRR